jgi:hypothetical protein
MERLESHFRLQRQTMGILAQLNVAAVANGIGTTTDSSTAAGESLIDSGGAPTASFSDSSVSSRGGPWAFKVLHSIRHWRARRDWHWKELVLSSPGKFCFLTSYLFLLLFLFELDYPRVAAWSLNRFQPPRRMDSLA